MTKSDRYTLTALMNGLKQNALSSGRYPAPYTPKRYDNRHELGKPFRCMGYNRLVRQINALDKVLKVAKSKPDWKPGRFDQMIGK
jgi:hypothetical protein